MDHKRIFDQSCNAYRLQPYCGRCQTPEKGGCSINSDACFGEVSHVAIWPVHSCVTTTRPAAKRSTQGAPCTSLGLVPVPRQTQCPAEMGQEAQSQPSRPTAHRAAWQVRERMHCGAHGRRLQHAVPGAVAHDRRSPATRGALACSKCSTCVVPCRCDRAESVNRLLAQRAHKRRGNCSIFNCMAAEAGEETTVGDGGALPQRRRSCRLCAQVWSAVGHEWWRVYLPHTPALPRRHASTLSVRSCVDSMHGALMDAHVQSGFVAAVRNSRAQTRHACCPVALPSPTPDAHQYGMTAWGRRDARGRWLCCQVRACAASAHPYQPCMHGDVPLHAHMHAPSLSSPEHERKTFPL